MTDVVKLLRNAAHLKTDSDVRKFGRSAAEVCFLGRSNVGKSSLINAICARKNMAHASRLPGKTRTINAYEVVAGHWLVDLPGYGFAVGGGKAKEELGGIIESYLKDRQTLQMVYVIVDAAVGPTKLDRMMTDWLHHYGFPFCIVVNKFDKIGVPRRDVRKKEIVQALGLADRPVFWVSTTKKLGLVDLQNNVALHLGLIKE